MIGHHQRWRQEPALLSLQLTPNGVGRFTDPLFSNKLSRHRREDVIVLFERVQSLSGELALHRKRDQHLLGHQSQATRLHSLLIVQIENADGLALAYPPRA